jgi:hypothetical protein
MNTFWIPAAPLLAAVHVTTSPFQPLTPPTRAELAESRDVPAAERRLQLPNFVGIFHWDNLASTCPSNCRHPGSCPPGQAAGAAHIIAGWPPLKPKT